MMTTTINNITWIGETYGDFLNILFFVVIIIVLLNKIHNYEKSHVIYSRDTIKIQLNWLKLTLFVLVVLMIVWLSFTVGYLIDDELVFYPLYLAASLTIYWLGYIGIYKIGINEQRQKIREVVIHKEVLLKESSFINEQLSSFENLIKEKRLFLDGNLKLDTIASQLNVSKGHLSRTVNSELGISFSDYINNLRVEEAKSYLSNPEFDRYTLVAIGLEAGFNSKSTFYSTFKKFTGLTPLQFKNNLNN
jgi:AraC-like DNA-binding protein